MFDVVLPNHNQRPVALGEITGQVLIALDATPLLVRQFGEVLGASVPVASVHFDVGITNAEVDQIDNANAHLLLERNTHAGQVLGDDAFQGARRSFRPMRQQRIFAQSVGARWRASAFASAPSDGIERRAAMGTRDCDGRGCKLRHAGRKTETLARAESLAVLIVTPSGECFSAPFAGQFDMTLTGATRARAVSLSGLGWRSPERIAATCADHERSRPVHLLRHKQRRATLRAKAIRRIRHDCAALFADFRLNEGDGKLVVHRSGPNTRCHALGGSSHARAFRSVNYTALARS